MTTIWKMGAVLAVLVAPGCSKSGRTSKEIDPLIPVAADAIKHGLTPDVAQCELKFEVPLGTRNVANSSWDPPRQSVCLKEDTPQNLRNCWNALDKPNIAIPLSNRFSECLSPMNGSVNVENYTAAMGIVFSCGKFSRVDVQKVDQWDPDRLRVSYKLHVEVEAEKMKQLERQCGDITVPAPREQTVSLFRDGNRWALPGGDQRRAYNCGCGSRQELGEHIHATALPIAFSCDGCEASLRRT